jgi:hypothetical protein
MRHDPSFRLTLRLSEQATAANPKQKLAIYGARNVPRALCDRGPRLRRHLPRRTTRWIISGDEVSFRLLGRHKPFLCSWHAPRRLLLHADRANMRNTGLRPSQKRGWPLAGMIWVACEPTTHP